MRDTIETAREAGMVYREFEDEFANANTDGVDLETLKAFEALVRADEQEKYKWDIHSCGPTCKRYACVAMREAVEAEREACAKEADKWSKRDDDVGAFIGKAIRARGQE
jgi:hypothetical protein